MKYLLLLLLCLPVLGEPLSLSVTNSPKGVVLSWPNRPGLYIVQKRPYVAPSGLKNALDWTELDRVTLPVDHAPMFHYRPETTADPKCFYRVRYFPL